MRCLLLLMASVSLFAYSNDAVFAQKKKANYTPTKAYRQMDIEGFTVMVHPKADPEKTKIYRAELVMDSIRRDIALLNRVVPKDHLKVMKGTKIWLDNDPEHLKRAKHAWAGAYVGSSSKDLREAGEINPDKSKSVLLDIDVSALGTGILIHEMGHAFHHQALTNDNPEVKAAYDQAMERKLYDSGTHAPWLFRAGSLVAEVDPRPQKAYATKSPSEYFAELTCVYFDRGKYFPHHWQELKEHDPVGWKLMEKVYGTPNRDTRKSKLIVLNTMPQKATIFHVGPKGKQVKGKLEPNAHLEMVIAAGERLEAAFAKPEKTVLFIVPPQDESVFEVAYQKEVEILVKPGAIPSKTDLGIEAIVNPGDFLHKGALVRNHGPETYTPSDGIRKVRFTVLDEKGKTIETEEVEIFLLPKGIGRVVNLSRCPPEAATIRAQIFPQGNDPNPANDSLTLKLPKK